MSGGELDQALGCTRIRHTLMLAPHAIRRSQIMNARQILELFDWGLAPGDPKLMLKLARGGDPDTKLVLFDLFLLEVIQGVRTASIRPHIGEGYLL